MDNPGQVVTDLEEEVVKKKNKCAAKKKERIAKFHDFVRSLLSPHPEFSPFLLPCSMPAPMPALMLALVPTLMPAFMPASMPALVSASIPALVSHLKSSNVLLSCYALVFCRQISALLLSLPSGLSLTLFLGSSPFRIFK